MPMPWPQPSAVLLQNCQIFSTYERFNWMAHAVSLARTSGDDYLIAFSGGTDHELNGFLNFAVKRTTLGGLKIVKFVGSNSGRSRQW